MLFPKRWLDQGIKSWNNDGALGNERYFCLGVEFDQGRIIFGFAASTESLVGPYCLIDERQLLGYSPASHTELNLSSRELGRRICSV